ncbi:MAG: type III pantothenate kinase [Actinobacteria bacterium]|nr:type III pantothenate kinase [Actinomycetota bacterium]
MKFLAVDVGNSRVAFGVFQDGVLIQAEHHTLGSDRTKLTEAVQVWGEMTVDSGGPAVLAGVNPSVCELVRQTLVDDVGLKTLSIGSDVPLPMKVDLPAPEKVGVDRILNAVAAYGRIKESVAVIDAGTAITVDFVSAEGIFLGGAILPGLGLSARILHEGTALLPLVEVTKPEQAIGRDTAEAISVGIFFGALGAIREIIERYATDLGFWPTTIITGGDGRLIHSECDFIQANVPELTLLGIDLAYRKVSQEAG